MKKRTILFPILILLLSLTAALFSGCENGKDPGGEDVTTAAGQVELDISSYVLVRPEKCTDAGLKKIVNFRLSLNEAVKTNYEIKEDWVKGELTDKELLAKEILVGKTNRPHSSDALTHAEHNTSFVIQVTENKVVINSATDDGLAVAMDHFLTLINGDGKLVLPSADYLYVSEPLPAIDVIKNGKSSYKIVYKDGLDCTSSSDPDSKDKCDYEVDYCKSLRETISKASSVKLDLANDWVKKDEDTSGRQEILIGITSRPETLEFLNSLAFDEYGYGVVGNKIVVTGWNLTTIKLACEAFEKFIPGAISRNADGNADLTLLEGVRTVSKADGYYIDFPEFGYGTLSGCMDSGNGDMEVMYTGCTKDNFTDYCKKLDSAGFTCWQTNDLDGNLSATYTGKDGLVHAYFVPSEEAVRIITCPDGKYSLPDCVSREAVAPYTKVTDTKITQMNLNYSAGNFGMCYIITLEDGSFIVIDGGGYNADYGDSARLYNNLKALNKRPDGKIVIAAWMISHEHWDHVTNFINLITAHPGEFKLEGIYLNTPCVAECYNVNNPNYYIDKNFTSISNAVGGTKLIRVHTGMHFCIRNAEFDVLYTEEDIYPDRNNYFNETSIIARMKAGGQSIIWLGDNKNWGSNTATRRYTSVIKGDIAQVSHHGYDGSSIKLYQAINAKTLFWPTSDNNVKGFEKSTSSSAYISVDKYLIQQYGYDKIIIAEPTKTITLPYNNGDTIVTEKY